MFQTLISLDNQISLFFRSLVHATDQLAKAIPLLSDIEVFLAVAFLVIWWLRGSFDKNETYKIQALDVFYSIAFAFAVYWVLNLGLPMRPRPETISGLPPLINHLPDNSFPSGHAIFAGASAYAISRFVSWKLWLGFIFLGVVMLLCRVIAGVHYFGDVLVWSILGMVCGIAYSCVRRRWSEKTALFSVPVRIAAFFKL